jgi:hypothetical protein
MTVKVRMKRQPETARGQTMKQAETAKMPVTRLIRAIRIQRKKPIIVRIPMTVIIVTAMITTRLPEMSTVIPMRLTLTPIPIINLKMT